MCVSSPAQRVSSSALRAHGYALHSLVHSLQIQGHPFLHSRRKRERRKKGEGREKRQNLEIITAIILTFRTTVEVQSYSDP